MKNDLNDLDEFTIAYLECALWAENDQTDERGGESFDENYGIGDFTDEAIQKAKDDCKRFQKETAASLRLAKYGHESISDTAMAGHDFWLTRNGHGAGFWSRDLRSDVAERLSRISEAMGNCDLYLTDEKTICML